MTDDEKETYLFEVKYRGMNTIETRTIKAEGYVWHDLRVRFYGFDVTELASFYDVVSVVNLTMQERMNNNEH